MTSALSLPLVVNAESNVQSGAATTAPGATAKVDFQIVVPKILFLRVGTGSSYTTGAYANNGTVDLVTFSPTAAQLGNGTAVSGTGGDLATGIETAAIISNSGNVTLNATAAAGGLTNAAGDSINFSQIKTAAAALTAGYTLLNAPVLANGTSANIVLTAPATKTIQADARWTFTFANTTLPPTGTYGGVNVNGGRVTYTATMP
jgi:hypothetical protein